ncbi:hypothetical protein [Nocardioides campestrisoli]|uniref:hypothetical protein n=1 Tax=Nocardioides campestrisoli TaxID=2736757 RepID=UPI00163D71BE|nr:hypothetical protein [Nocardioides campestrisoli]
MSDPRPGTLPGSVRRGAAVAGATLAVTGAASLLLAWLIATASMTFGQLLTTAGVLLAGAFGAGVDGSMSGSFVVVGGTASGSATAVPLTLTLLAGATAVLAFRRVSRDVPHTGAATPLVDAAVAAALVAVGVLVVALLARTGSGGILVALDWIAARDADQVRGDAGVVPWRAPLGAFALMLGVLGVLAVTTLGERLRAPVHGLVTLLLLLPVAGVLGVLMLAGGDPAPTGDVSVEAASGVGLGLAALATWGFAVLALGALGPAGYTVDGSASGDLEVTLGAFHSRLGHWTDSEPGLWAAIPVAVLVLGLSALRVARSSTDVRRVPGDLLRWLALLAVVLPGLAVVSRLSGTGRVAGQSWGEEGRGELTGTLGLDLWPATLHLLALAGAVALVVGLLARARGRRPGDRLSAPSDRRTLEETSVTPVTGGSSDGHPAPPHP